MRLILPASRPDLRTVRGIPLFYITGVQRGAEENFELIYKALNQHRREYIAAIPCQYSQSHYMTILQMESKRKYATEQEWRKYYLHQAGKKAKHGCIIIWLAEKLTPQIMVESQTMDLWYPYLKAHPDARVVLGIEKDYPDRHKLSAEFRMVLGNDLIIHRSISKLVTHAIHTALQ